MELWNCLNISLEKNYPGIEQHICLASCEEDIRNIPSYVGYVQDGGRCEKEHVLLCLNFEFGGRTGTLLCDPGYHVSKAVTVMPDRSYPHTGMIHNECHPQHLHTKLKSSTSCSYTSMALKTLNF